MSADLLDALAMGLRAICTACQRADCRCATWCAECGITNHSTAQHRAADAEGRKEP